MHRNPARGIRTIKAAMTHSAMDILLEEEAALRVRYRKRRMSPMGGKVNPKGGTVRSQVGIAFLRKMLGYLSKKMVVFEHSCSLP
jgi:hypothetical protein